jgi:probable rRNA maturation factor
MEKKSAPDGHSQKILRRLRNLPFGFARKGFGQSSPKPRNIFHSWAAKRGIVSQRIFMNRIKLYYFNFPGSLKKIIARAAKAAMNRLKFTRGEINFILVSDKKIRQLNRSFRNVKRITDVISFRYDGFAAKDKKQVQGDIIIAKGRSQKQATAFDHSWEHEVAYLVIHGVLHLAGYTDYVPKERKRMFKLQDNIFKCLYS